MKVSNCILPALLILQSFIWPCSSHSQSSIPYGDNVQAGAYVMLNGVRHYYEVYGNGRPMLLIHGNGTATKGWAAQIDYFSKQYRVYSVDCRGRGKSDLGPDTLRFDQMASDMAAFIKAMKLDSVDVVGKSDGAIIAILMGIHHPAHLRRIVAFAANMQPDTTALTAVVLNEISNQRKEAEHMLAVGDKSKKWEVERQRYRLDEFQPRISGRDLGRISVPVLVLSGDRDAIKPSHTLWIYQHIPLANLCILPGETHHVPREHPELFNQMVDGFLSKPFVPDPTRIIH
jgi:pimeloyl-ACP methyl ester carboxylesterase